MERNAVILLALLGLVLSACAADKPRGGLDIRPVKMPEWAYTGHHPDFPDNHYIVSFGLARGSAEAAQTAEDRLEERICAEAIEPHKALLKDSRFAQVVTEPAAWFRLSEFGNAVKTDAASDGFDAVAVRAIDRDELRLRARAMLPAAHEALTNELEPPRGLGSIPKRMELWGKYYMLAIRVVALELLANNTLDRTSFDKVEDALMALWELPALIKTSLDGGGQHVRIHGGCAAPLILGAYFRGKPVAGAPVKWAPGAGFHGSVEGANALDDTGRAQCKVLYIEPTGDEFGYVQAQLDIDRAVGRRTGIAMNVWLWQVKLPSRKSGQLVLHIKETKGGKEPLARPMFVPEVEKWATGRNLASTTGEPDADKYAYHLLLEGKVDVTSTAQGDVPGAYVSGDLTLTDTETGEVLFRYAVGLRRDGEKGNTEDSIMLGAMQAGAADVMAEFASRILVALPGKDKEFGRER